MNEWSDEEFIALMKDALVNEPMTDEQAALDAIADYRTERQESRMTGLSSNYDF